MHVQNGRMADRQAEMQTDSHKRQADRQPRQHPPDSDSAPWIIKVFVAKMSSFVVRERRTTALIIPFLNASKYLSILQAIFHQNAKMDEGKRAF